MCNYLTFKSDPPNHTQQKFLSLYKYIDLAKKIINNEKQFALLSSEDIISDVVHSLIIADWKYNPKYNNKQSFRYVFAIKAIKSILNKKMKKQYDFEKLDLDNYRKELYIKEVFELLNWSSLSSIERECLTLRYLHNYTLQEITNILDLTYPSVTKCINKALNKLKKYV